VIRYHALQNPVFLILFIVASALLLTGCTAKTDEQLSLSGHTMGTTWSALIARPQGLDANAIQLAINKRLQEINQLMSTFITDSEISLFNQQQSRQWVSVSDDLVKLVAMANVISDKTQGGFDISAGPLVNLWGFGAANTTETRVPEAALLQSTLKRVGYKNLLYRKTPPALKKLVPDLYIDLSAIAKGFAVDELAALLKQQGATDFLIEIGGEMFAQGLSSRNDHWKVGIEKPVAGVRSVQQIVKLVDGAMATSGNYRNYFKLLGKRYSHLLDPRKGYPVTHQLASVSVFHKSVAQADAWATALMILGEREGFELAQSIELAAYFTYKDGNHFKTRYTTQFAPLLIENTQ